MSALGIMTHNIRSVSAFNRFAEEASRLGFDSTVLFTPNNLDFGQKVIHAFRYRNGSWLRTACRFPNVAHDMGFYTGAAETRKVKRIKRLSGIPFTGHGLGSKWLIHQRLLQSPYASCLPETKLYLSPDTVIGMLRAHKTVMVKPKNGKRGTGIVKIGHTHTSPTPYAWHEKDESAQHLSERALSARLQQRFQKEDAVVQRWLDIRDTKGGVFDIRALVQKETPDCWNLTEMAVRQSAEGRIASNVSKGGSIWPVAPFLAQMYSPKQAERITDQCRRIAAGLPSALESLYGKPFAELGIDLAVEQGGCVRIIEVNIKPGKQIVRALSGRKAYADALVQPIRYAKMLNDRRDFPSKDS